MDLVPRREYTDGEKTERLYNEIMTGERAWTLQVRIALLNHSHLMPDVVLKSYHLGQD